MARRWTLARKTFLVRGAPRKKRNKEERQQADYYCAAAEMANDTIWGKALFVSERRCRSVF